MKKHFKLQNYIEDEAEDEDECSKDEDEIDDTKTFINEVKSADVILYSPGGPAIGDIYYDNELSYYLDKGEKFKTASNQLTASLMIFTFSNR